MELIRAVGGISWVVGLVLLFTVPVVGLIVLGVAVLATIWSVQQTRERRHQELLAATRRNQK
jgi:preprotein translocase subunit YajC